MLYRNSMLNRTPSKPIHLHLVLDDPFQFFAILSLRVFGICGWKTKKVSFCHQYSKCTAFWSLNFMYILHIKSLPIYPSSIPLKHWHDELFNSRSEICKNSISGVLSRWDLSQTTQSTHFISKHSPIRYYIGAAPYNALFWCFLVLLLFLFGTLLYQLNLPLISVPNVIQLIAFHLQMDLSSSNTERYPPLVGIIKLHGGSVLLGDKYVFCFCFVVYFSLSLSFSSYCHHFCDPNLSYLLPAYSSYSPQF